MEAGKIYKLPGHKSCATDLDSWKQAKEWPADGGFTKVSVYKCPLAGRFGCKAEFAAEMKLPESTTYQLLESRGVHDDDSHHPDKNKSKQLKWKQIEAIHTGVRISPNQSARQLRRNLVNPSPEKRISPKLLWNMKRQVVRVRAELTLEQLNTVKIGWFVRQKQNGFRLYLSSIMIEAVIFISTCTTFLLLARTSMQQKTSRI